jgi:hypothetical protein
MNTDSNMSNSQMEVIIGEVWGKIAEEIGDQLPLLIYAAIEMHLPRICGTDAVDDFHEQIAASLGPLSYD